MKSPAPNLSQWWRRFRDPTLDGMVADAIARNLDVEDAKAAIRQARAQRREAAAGLLPTADGSASATRSLGAGNLFRLGFDAGWEIDLFGGAQRTLEAAHHAEDAAQENLRATLVTVIGEIAANYVDLRSAQARIALARRTARLQGETLALIRTKHEAGSVSALDLARATGSYNTTLASIPPLETAVAQATHRLSVLTGRPPAALGPLLRRPGPIPALRGSLPAGIPAAILTRRPDIRRAERELAAATAQIGQAEAALYPSISLTGNISTTGASLGELARKSSIAWSWGPSVNVPIFDAGRLRAVVESRQAARDKALVAWHAGVLTALEEVENALVTLTQERRRQGNLAAALRAQRDSNRLSRTLYEAGSATFLDVLEADQSLFSAEESVLQSRAALATATIALAKALGGGWDGPVDASRPLVVDDMGPRLALPGSGTP